MFKNSENKKLQKYGNKSNKNLGNKITKIWEQKLQNFQKYGNKNLGTKFQKYRKKI
jgi:hypothetical protein